MTQASEADKKDRGLPDPAGLIEKAWQWRWAVRLAHAVLFADIVLGLSGLEGLLQFSLYDGAIYQNFGVICVAVCAFGLFVCFALPVMAFVARHLIFFLRIYIPWPSFFISEKYDSRPLGYVLVSELRDRALSEQSTFLFSIYEKHMSTEHKTSQHREQVGILTFGLLILGIVDQYLPNTGITNSTLITQALSISGDWGLGLWGTSICLLIVWLYSAWFPEWQVRWAYYPPLYREIMAKKKADQKKQDALMNSWRHDE